jgi:hypothetical protein
VRIIVKIALIALVFWAGTQYGAQKAMRFSRFGGMQAPGMMR